MRQKHPSLLYSFPSTPVHGNAGKEPTHKIYCQLGSMRMLKVRGLGLPTAARLLLASLRATVGGHPRAVFLCSADPYEPGAGKVPKSGEAEQVDRWVRQSPRFVRYQDSAGRPPQHTFFYPAE